jgi:hypothetical protein
VSKVLLLLVVFHLKHFLADYPLQGGYMLGKFKGGWDWVKPLAAHCGVHAIFTFVISLGVHAALDLAIGLAALDFALHFTMDRIKASPNLLGRFKALSAKEYPGVMSYTTSPDEDARAKAFKQLRDNKYFWWALGLDQLVHHLTDILIIAFLVGAI